MRKDKLGDLSMELSVEVLQLTKELNAMHENVISNQIGRSTTSICANIAESKDAHGRADFIAKLEISLKETNEISKWLEMLWKSEYIDEARYKVLDRKCSTIRFLLVKSITTAKKNIDSAKEKK
ncbi:MAG: four helix bundle protein [Clostridia bacterium]|nr:four helix bundle protein [Clostridia bacterium]